MTVSQLLTLFLTLSHPTPTFSALKNWTEWDSILGTWQLKVGVPEVNNLLIDAKLDSYLVIHITCDPLSNYQCDNNCDIFNKNEVCIATPTGYKKQDETCVPASITNRTVVAGDALVYLNMAFDLKPIKGFGGRRLAAAINGRVDRPIHSLGAGRGKYVEHHQTFVQQRAGDHPVLDAAVPLQYHTRSA